MADLTVGPRGADAARGRPGDRAQIILVGAFGLAVVFVALALVMNAAIYTENLATRSETAATADAHAYQRATEAAAEEAFHYANAVNDSTYADLDANVTEAMATYYNVSRTQVARDGRLVEVSVATTTQGTNITDDTGTFEGPSGGDDWQLADNVNRTRRFRIDIAAWSGDDDQEFRVVADNVETWYLNVSHDGPDYEIGVNDSSSYTACETTTSDSISIDFSEGTVNGDSCAALDLHDVTGPYELRFENGSAVDGEYRVVVDADETATYSSPSSGDPVAEDALYDMTVELTYWTPELRYVTTIRVAPGEYDG